MKIFDIKKTASFVSYDKGSKDKALIIYPPHKRVPHVHLNELGFDEYIQKFSDKVDLLDLTHFFFGSINCGDYKQNKVSKQIDWDFFIQGANKKRISDFLTHAVFEKELEESINVIGSYIPKDYDQYIFVLGFPKQTSMALCLAKYLKKDNKKIVMTRAILNSYLCVPARMKELIYFHFVDFVVNSFEKNIIDLISGKDVREIEGVSYKEDGKIKENKLQSQLIRLTDLPAPKYKHLEDNKVKIIYYELSRGCVNKCECCSHSNQPLNIRSIGSVIDDLRYLIRKFNCRHFQFLCTSINFSKKYVLDLCDEITANALGIKWSSYILLNLIDEEVAGRLHAAGCVFVDSGVESASISHLNSNKITGMPVIERSLALLRKNNIKSSVSFIIGSINYKRNEGEKIIKFLVRNKENIDIVNLNMFEIHPLNVSNIIKNNKNIRVGGKYLLDQRYYEFSDNKFKDYNERRMEISRVEKNIKDQVEGRTNIKVLHWEDFPLKEYKCCGVEAAYVDLFNE